MLTNPRLAAMRAKRDGINEKLEAIDANAAARPDLALTDEETNEYGELTLARTKLNEDIEALSRDIETNAAVGATLARITTADDSPFAGAMARARGGEGPSVSPGEYACLFVRAAAFNDDDAKAQLAALHASFPSLARATDLTTNITGVLPVPIVGDVIKFVDSSRYAVNAMRELPHPHTKTWTRPRVTTRTTAAQQTEGSALSSTAMVITSDTVTNTTQGGFVTVTEQDIDFSDPAFWQILIEDLAESYAIRTEVVATAAIVAAATNTVTGVTVGTTASDVFLTKLAAAAGTVYSNSKQLPDTLFAAVSVWQYLAAMVDGNKRLQFPNLAPFNAAGGTMDLTSFAGNPMGLRLVVSPQFAADTMIVAASRYCERYEWNKGQSQITAPSTLTADVAYRGYFAANVYAQGLCAITV